MRGALREFIADEDGADLIEYALLLGLLSMACFLAMTSLGTSLNGLFNGVATKLSTLLP
jgi:pilus assembly protein Flp/PilA